MQIDLTQPLYFFPWRYRTAQGEVAVAHVSAWEQDESTNMTRLFLHSNRSIQISPESLVIFLLLWKTSPPYPASVQSYFKSFSQ